MGDANGVWSHSCEFITGAVFPCAARSRAGELERLRQMTVEARIRMALTIDARFSWLKPAAMDH